MGFFDFFRSLFGGRKVKDEELGDLQSASVRARAKRDREECFARVDALYNKWLKAVNDFDAAKEAGKPRHVIEELYQQSKRLERAFNSIQEELRDARDIQDMQERTVSLQCRVERLVGEKASGAVYTKKDEYLARKKMENEMAENELEDEIHDEQMRAHKNRHAPPEFADEDVSGDDLDLNPISAAAGQEKSQSRTT